MSDTGKKNILHKLHYVGGRLTTFWGVQKLTGYQENQLFLWLLLSVLEHLKTRNNCCMFQLKLWSCCCGGVKKAVKSFQLQTCADINPWSSCSHWKSAASPTNQRGGHVGSIQVGVPWIKSSVWEFKSPVKRYPKCLICQRVHLYYCTDQSEGRWGRNHHWLAVVLTHSGEDGCLRADVHGDSGGFIFGWMTFVVFIDISMKTKPSKTPPKVLWCLLFPAAPTGPKPTGSPLPEPQYQHTPLKGVPVRHPFINPPGLMRLTAADGAAASRCSWWADKPATQIFRSADADC